MSAPFRVSQMLRFGHCDPAGIAYYPRLLELVDAAIEDWTLATLAVSRRDLHLGMSLALPTVDLQARFIAPARLGETLDYAIVVAALGRASITLDVAVTCAGEERYAARLVQVLTGMDDMKACSWPDDMREKLGRQLREETQS